MYIKLFHEIIDTTFKKIKKNLPCKDWKVEGVG